MQDKEIIIRMSGTNEQAKDFFQSLAKVSEQLGITASSPNIREVPDKVSKTSNQKSNVKDVMVCLTANEETVEEFLEELSTTVEKKLGLEAQSINLKIEA